MSEQQELVKVDPEAQLANHEKEPAPQPFTSGGPMAAMIPQTPEDYGRMAKLIIDAGIIPAGYDKGSPNEVRAKLIIGMMKSVELGIPPITGLSNIMIVNNRPSVWGDLASSLIQRSGKLKSMKVETVGTVPHHSAKLEDWNKEFGYKVTMMRVGQDEPYEGIFTVGDAMRARLWMNHKKQPWINYPKAMLLARARAIPMRMGFADCLAGMGLIEVERDIVPDEPAEPLNIADLSSDEPDIPEAEIAEEEEVDVEET